MHFFSFSVLALALSAAIEAAPTGPGSGLVPRLRVPRSPRKPAPHYRKRGHKNSDNEDVNIQITDIQVEADIDGSEVLFEQEVTQIVIKNSDSNRKKNDRRRDFMKKEHENVNVVIQVVQVIVDVSSGSNRYAVSAILADNGSDQTTTCQITDSQTYTVGNGACANQAAATDASAYVLSDGTATATAVMAQATGGVSAPFNMANQTVLLPPEAGAPVPDLDVAIMDDPAAGILDVAVLVC